MFFLPATRDAWKVQHRGDMGALCHAHGAPGLGLVHWYPRPLEHLQKHAGRGAAAVIHRGPSPVEQKPTNHRSRLDHDSSFQNSSAMPNAMVIPDPPVPVQTDTPGMGSTRKAYPAGYFA